MGDVESEGWDMKFDGLGVAPDTSAFFASDVLNDLVEDFRNDKRMVLSVLLAWLVRLCA
jgi:hypothetical protein